MKKTFLAVLMAAACLTAGDSLGVSPPGTALPPPATGGVGALDLLLAKLSTHRRLLVVAAHPDDEDTALLTLVARGQGGEAAYLSLSRGDGGQNLIGPELSEGLGVIRTRELEAARKLDGARQYFTRAYDFGYSKSVEEAFRLWPRQEVLKDAVRVIRRFRPQVIDHIFSGTPRDGHGQHQESALIAHDAFQAAGDPSAFPELASEGLTPWQPAALYRSTRFLDRDATTVVLSTSGIDSTSGKSYQQIAVASRSLHRSQGTGALQVIGPNETRAAYVAGAGGPQVKDLFGAVDTSLPGIAAEIGEAGRRKRIEDRLRTVQKLAEETRRQLAPTTIPAALAPLSAILEELRAAKALASEAGEKPSGVTMLLDEKIRAAEGAMAIAAGAMVDALSERETAVAGESLAITVSAWNAGGQALEVRKVELATPSWASWRVPSAEEPAKGLDPGKLEEWKLSAGPPAGAAPSVPYFLRRPLAGDLYDWSDTPPPVRGEPFEAPLLTAVVTLAVKGTPFRVEREVTYRYRDEAFGEVRHALRVVPKVELTVEPDLLVWPVARKEPRSLDVTLSSNSPDAVSGSVVADVPPGWAAPAGREFRLEKRGDRAFVRLDLTPPAQARTGRWPVSIRAVLPGGEKLEGRIDLIDYEHIRPTPMPKSSAVSLTALDLKLPPLKRVGYVRGASDRVPEALKAVGVPIEEISARELEHGDLSRYDAIVIGPRAYETEPALVASNERVLDYARGGGLVVVQYQQSVFTERGFAPEKLEITRPFDRVTDETAPVKLLDPTHPIVTTPNRIGEADWDGWVQERGLYFANTWAPAYTPLLGMADPGETEKRGSLLAARVGKGRYVYTALAFFRELPAGVPGAYRLFANLLAWR
ncbi:MAG TPA: PIG-L family deacetylase [Thermoanaerobaculia bacterium]|nr:PIG-L family deacetylase [Thermoanaerobaculia bacterium]